MEDPSTWMTASTQSCLKGFKKGISLVDKGGKDAPDGKTYQTDITSSKYLPVAIYI